MFATVHPFLIKPWLCSLQGIDHIQVESCKTFAVDPFEHSTSHMFIVVIQGKGELAWCNRRTRLAQGDIQFVQAGVSFSITASADHEETLQFYKVHVDAGPIPCGQMPDQRHEENKAEPDRVLDIESYEAPLPVMEFSYIPWGVCLDHMKQLLRYQYADSLHEQWEIQARFQEWFRSLIRQNDPHLQLVDERKRIHSSIRYIETHYHKMFTVDELASRIGLSRGSYTRQFKRLTGKLPLDYINGIRLDHSKKLLQMTDDRLHDIAHQVGFSNEYYFSRKFKQYAGISPGVYRRHHRKDIKVFAPFLEDYLLALEVKPVLLGYHRAWGKQHYLEVDDVPDFDISQQHSLLHEEYMPEFIMLDRGYQKWNLERFEQLAPVYYIHQEGEQWREILKVTADLLGKTNRAQEVIASYEDKAAEARGRLQRYTRGETFAFLRISASEITLYGEHFGYVGPILYQDLGLTPHICVKKWTHRQRRVRIELEQLCQLQADHLLITFDALDSVDGEERRLLDRQEWKQLPAVRRGNVYEVDFMPWMNYGVISHGKKIDDMLRFMG